MIKSILLPVDGSQYSELVLKYGIFLAKKTTAYLKILTVIDIRLFDWSMAVGSDSFVPVMPSTDFQEESRRVQDDKADQIVQKAKTILDGASVEYEINKVSGIPVDEICIHAKHSDLVVMGIRGEYEKWTSKLLGVTVEAVTRHISKPLLLVEKSFIEPQRILCGYDGSDTADHALKLSAYISEIMKIPLQVINISNKEEERKQILAHAELYLKPYDIEFTLRHESGHADSALINAQIDAPSSLLIMGSYGHSRLREAILGSTTVHVMREAVKPILLTK